MERQILALLAAALLILATTTRPLLAQTHHGVVEFETSCDASAEADINNGVAHLHHMMYDVSAQAFAAAAEADPECAMAHWGLAMTQLHPLWAPPTEEEVQKGRDAVAKARSVGSEDERERAYIEAIGAFFETDGDFPTRLAAWEAKQRTVYEKHLDDEDAGAFSALAKLAVASKSDKTFAANKEAGALVEKLHAEHPEHPGLFHYTIHAYDNPVLAEQALDAARGYDKLAPEVPHALHMPSHIFVRVGEWEDVADWNRRSAAAALKHSSGGLTTMHYPHAIDYLVYARLQQGRDDDATKALDELRGNGPFRPELAAAYALAAAPARLALERRSWADAADLSVREPADFSWDRFPAAESITWFAKGLGAARTENIEGANAALEHLDQIHQQLAEAGDAYWAVHTDAQRKAVGAWIAFAEGDAKEALQMMQAAAEIEDSVDKHPVTPGAVLPARELLGEMLLEMERPAEALAAFEASLAVSPKRLNSLSGAGRAAELAGDREKAAAYYRDAVALVEGADSVARPRMADARRVAGE